MTDLLAAVLFAALLAVTAVARLRERDGPSRRGASLFIGYVVAASLLAGITQRELWPFSAWPLLAVAAPREVEHSRLAAVDDAGTEHEVDFRAFQPLGFDELITWMHFQFPRLAPGPRAEVAAHLLARLESARRQARATGTVGYFHRFLGPLAAPTYLLHPARWSSAEKTPSRPFVALRLYRLQWDVRERGADGPPARRTLVFEHRP